jgi:predicted DNA-binding transcriptional regulator AlpA
MDNKQTEKEFLNSRELASRWCCSISTIDNIRNRGTIPYWKPEGARQFLYPVEAIMEYEAERMKGVKVKKTLYTGNAKQWRVN